METSKKLAERLRLMGCRVRFKPWLELESQALLLKVRHPAGVVDGRLLGSEIDVYNKSTFRVWTSQKRKAKAYAVRYHLQIRSLDGECELFVPADLSDAILPKFGAKVKRSHSPERQAALRAFWQEKHRKKRGS